MHSHIYNRLTQYISYFLLCQFFEKVHADHFSIMLWKRLYQLFQFISTLRMLEDHLWLFVLIVLDFLLRIFFQSIKRYCWRNLRPTHIITIDAPRDFIEPRT